MSADWKELTLGEFIRLQRGHDLTASEQKEGNIPVMGSAGQNGTHSESKASGKGVVIGRSGASMGRVHYCETDYWPHNTCLYVTDFLGNDPLFAYYKLAEMDLARYNSGSAQPSLNRNYIYGMTLSVPEPKTQKQVAQIIRRFDEKIALNRQINQTLEAMAQAIFKSWFVDFDPVKAKIAAIEAGQDPLRAAMSAISGKSDAELDAMPRPQYEELAATAALFPEELVESELGDVPKGWEVRHLGAVADVSWGDTKTTKSSYVDSGHVAYSASGPDGYLPHFDFDKTGIVVSAIGANSGATWLAHGKWSCIKNTIRLWSVAVDVSTEYLYHATCGKHLWPLRGSAQPFISQADARLIRIIHPNNNLAKEFGRRVESLHTTIKQLNEESLSLGVLRDTLLPKLLSGELSVADLEEEV